MGLLLSIAKEESGATGFALYERYPNAQSLVLRCAVSCARCHDHKFDPIPVTDSYALAGIFTSSDDAAGLRSKMGGGGLDYYRRC